MAGINCHNSGVTGTGVLVACLVSLLRLNLSTYLGSVWLFQDCLEEHPTRGLSWAASFPQEAQGHTIT